MEKADLDVLDVRLTTIEWFLAEAIAMACGSERAAKEWTDRMDANVDAVIARRPDLDPAAEAKGRVLYDALLSTVRAIAHARDADRR